MLLENLRAQVVQFAQQMVKDGLSHGSAGNISAQDAASGFIAITPSAIDKAILKPEDIILIDDQGQVIESLWKPTTEIRMHLIFYQERSDVGAVVHSHAPYATLFAITHEPIPLVLAESAPALGEPVQVAPYARTGTEALAKVVLDFIGHGTAVLLANHGLLTIGKNLSQAYSASLAAELCARYTYMARAMGAHPVELDPAEVAALQQVMQSYHPTQIATHTKMPPASDSDSFQ